MSSPEGITAKFGGTQWYVKKASEMGLHQKEPVFLGLFIAWLLTGTLFYSYAPDFGLGFIKGFYMAINIGYSIGFGYPIDPNTRSIWFSIFYVLIGSSFVGVALGFFAEKITEDSETWFSRLQDQKKIEDFILLGKTRWRGRIHAFLYRQRAAIRAVLVWLALVVVLVIISLYGVGWTFKEGLYFSISTLSTGGHWMIPQESPLWLYGVTAGITAIGVPLMALAMAAVGTALMDQGNLEEAKSAIDDPVTPEELQLMEDLGLEDGDGKLDLTEYVLLCMVRIGTDPGLLSYIRQRFKELSDDGEILTIEQVTERAYTLKDGKIFRMSAVEQPPGGLPLVEEEEDDFKDDTISSVDSEKETAPEGAMNHGKLLDMEEGYPQERIKDEVDVDEIADEMETNNNPQEDTIRTVQMLPDQFEAHQFTEKTVLVARHLDEGVRSLRSRDDFGMALLDREYIMNRDEEKALLKEARRRMQILLDQSYNEEGWTSKGRIAGVKISSKEGMDGAPLNLVKGETDFYTDFSLDFGCAQWKYEMRSNDSFSRVYSVFDPMMVQAAMPTRIRSLDLLDEAAMEDCVVLWVAIRSPVGLVNDRDFCLVFHFRKTQCPLTGNVIALTNFFSIMHPSVPDMERALDRVRGEIIMGGYIMRPKPDDDSQFCLQYMIQYNDPKGALPNAVVNAVILSQGLNAGRFREYTWKMTKMAWDLTKGRIPIGCYDVRRGAKTEHRLQLRVSGDQFPVNANTLRTFKFQVAVHASFTVLMKLSTNDANGVPLPVTIRRSDQSDAMAKVFAGGNTVAFGWNGFHMFHATLLMAVEGPLPEFLTLRFRNTLWRQNHVYVPAITELTQVTTPEPSLSGNSMVSSGRGKSPKFRRALTPSDRSTD